MKLRRIIIGILKGAHSIHVAAGLSFITSIAVLAFTYNYWVIYPTELTHKIDSAVAQATQVELANLSKNGEEVASNPLFVRAVAEKDADKMLSLLNTERDRRGVDRFAVVDSDGFVVSRTALGYLIGDNAFLQSPAGRVIASGVDRTSSVESGTQNPRELFFVSSVPINEHGKRIGTLFVSDRTSNAFAAKFAASIAKNASVAFYRDVYGVYGSNISNARDRELFNATIQANSDNMKHYDDPIVFRTSDGHVYLARNIMLQGVEAPTGNVTVFIPLSYFSWLLLLGMFLPYIVFIFFCSLLHRQAKKEFGGRFYYVTAAVFGLVGMAITGFIFFYAHNKIPKLEDSPYPLYNSILSIQPESGVFDLDSEQKISIILDSGDEPINTINVQLIYDPSVVAVESVDTTDSVCDYFLTNSSDTKGFIDVECVIPNPGFQGKEAKVADVYVKGKVAGSVPFRFAEGSSVLANDGLGTDVLRQVVGASFLFQNRVEGFDTAATTTVAFSSSHPNPERWYPEKSVMISWLPRRPSEIFVQNPDGSTSTQSFNLPPAKINVTTDGEYIFQVVSTSTPSSTPAVIHARVDHTPPNQVLLEASDTHVKSGDIVRFVARAQDATSGLQRTFFLRIDNNLFFPISTEVHVPFFDPGAHTVTLRAYDNAGNFKESSVTVEVVK